ncbi:hypothetical protein HYX05_05405 [Candidatus Woesearchaeota archaeon]|nr:hypothetical protein [Candidatus Woesearchaeota archaeon]
MNTKSQAWYMDFAIALLLFTFTLVVYFSYTSNFQKQEKGDLDSMLADAKAISSSLALSGYPPNWNNETVIRIGIADGQKVNATKIKYFKQLNYNDTKKKFGTVYEYFVFFTGEDDEVKNLNSICGTGHPVVTTEYNVKSAYYYSKETDSFLKDFINDSFHGDIYFGDEIDDLMANINNYGILVFEHPDISPSDFDEFKAAVEDYSSRGGLIMFSGQLVSAQGQNLVGADFRKKSGQSTSDRNATVNSTDQYLELNVGESIVFRQAYYVENKSNAADFKQIATFNQDQTNALSKWKYGNGSVYFFSDFDVSFFSGNFTTLVQEAAKSLIEGTCTSVNVTAANPKKLVKAERYLSYNSKIIKMVVYVWQ